MIINWNFLGGGGMQKNKTFHGGIVDNFWNCTIMVTLKETNGTHRVRIT